MGLFKSKLNVPPPPPPVQGGGMPAREEARRQTKDTGERKTRKAAPVQTLSSDLVDIDIDIPPPPPPPPTSFSGEYDGQPARRQTGSSSRQKSFAERQVTGAPYTSHVESREKSARQENPVRGSLGGSTNNSRQDVGNRQIPRKSTHGVRNELVVAGKHASDSRLLSSSRKADSNFVDYTVVPLLLRSGMDYASAENLGSLMRTMYSAGEVAEAMESPRALLAALHKERIPASDRFCERLSSDLYWRQQVGTSAAAEDEPDKRKSFLYRRSVTDQDAVYRRSVTKFETEPGSRASFRAVTSQRSQFAPTRAAAPPRPDDDGQQHMSTEQLLKAAEMLRQGRIPDGALFTRG